MNTEVELAWFEGRIERWIRFGRIVEERRLDRRRRIVCFAPDSLFALVRWQGGDHGTTVSRIAVLRAVRPGESFTTMPFVSPGAEILLDIAGWPKVEAVLAAIDAVEAAGVRAADAAPDHWRHVGARIGVGMPARRYDRARHRAWLWRRRLGL